MFCVMDFNGELYIFHRYGTTLCTVKYMYSLDTPKLLLVKQLYRMHITNMYVFIGINIYPLAPCVISCSLDGTLRCWHMETLTEVFFGGKKKKF